MKEVNRRAYDCIVAACEALEPEARAEARASGRTMASCMHSLMLPTIKAYLDPDGGKERQEDAREKRWHVVIRFWDVSDGFDNGHLEADNTDKGEIMVGLKSVGFKLQEYAETLYGKDHGIEVFSDRRMANRIGGAHPAISRGDGTCTLRMEYSKPGGDDKFGFATATITRA
tara:strand:+ start:35153 stop:35668 length:516 start_codon:yes stop_codon:yes gene_type:complete